MPGLGTPLRALPGGELPRDCLPSSAKATRASSSSRRSLAQASALPGLLCTGVQGTGTSWMESAIFPSLIWRQRGKLRGGTQASWIESTLITVCRGFCCLLFASLVHKLLAWGGEAVCWFPPACISSPQQQAGEGDGVSQPTVGSDLLWPPALGLPGKEAASHLS